MEIDDRELHALAADLGNVSAKTQTRLRAVLQEGSSDLKKEWQANAKESSGTHGKLYPYSIDWEQTSLTKLEFEVGPNPDKHVNASGPGKGGKVGRSAEGYEFGSSNQPPHLDGQRAADTVIPRLERRVGIVAEDLF